MTDSFDYELDYDLNDDRATLDDALEELSQGGQSIPSPEALYGLSDLTAAQLKQLAPVWEQLDATARRVILQMMIDVSESNVELNYRRIAYANLSSEDAGVRSAAIELLWEDESEELLGHLLGMARKDDSFDVRREAIRALGRFVLAGELGDLRTQAIKPVQEYLIALYRDCEQPLELRRIALESVSNCTRSEIPSLILDAYQNDDDEMRISSIIAMGRSCDTERWEVKILKELERIERVDVDVQIEIIRAAGELEIEDAVVPIMQAMEQGERPIQEVGVWALGEIGGDEAMRALQMLAKGAEDSEDEELLILIDDAIGNASLSNNELMRPPFMAD